MKKYHQHFNEDLTNLLSNATGKNIKSLVAATPSTIAYSEAPLSFGHEIRNMNTAEFEERFHTTWKEGIEVTIDPIITTQEPLIANLSLSEIHQQVRRILEKPDDRLILCRINDKVGHGVFAKESIPKDTVLAIYSASIDFISMKEEGLSFQYRNSPYFFNPKNFRGIASFFQHLPNPILQGMSKEHYLEFFQRALEEGGEKIAPDIIRQNEELLSIEFTHQQTIENLAMANLLVEYIVYEGIPLIVFLTRREINKNEQLGFNYGLAYWLHKEPPRYFDKQGLMLSRKEYRRNFGTICLSKEDYTGNFAPLINLIKTSTLPRVFFQNKRISLPEVERELIKMNALHASDGLKFNHFSKEKTYHPRFKYHHQKLKDFLLLLEQKALAFNESHCRMNNSEKGYWRYYELQKLTKASSTDEAVKYRINSAFFSEKYEGWFESKKGVSPWEACQSLVSENAFGIISDVNWVEICYYLTLMEYLGRELFECLFPKIILNSNQELFSKANKFSDGYGSIFKFTNHSYYPDRHPCGDYASLYFLKTREAYVGFGFEHSLAEHEISAFLDNKYDEEQHEQDLDTIRRFSAGHLLEYPYEKMLYGIKQANHLCAFVDFFVIIKHSTNKIELDAWLEWFENHYSKFNIEHLDYFVYQDTQTVDAFFNNNWWRFEFEEGKFNISKSIMVPKTRQGMYSCLPRFNEPKIREKYCPTKATPLIYSWEMLHVCHAVLAYFSNLTNFSVSHLKKEAFYSINNLRIHLLSLQKANQLAQYQTRPEPEKFDKLMHKNNKSLTLFCNTLQLSHEKENLLDNCYRLGIKQEGCSEIIVNNKRTQLLRFWHPDRNLSSKSTIMCQEINENANNAINSLINIEKLTNEIESQTNSLFVNQ